MAVIHISEEEAARDMPTILAQVKAGGQVHIADGDRTIAIIQPPPEELPRKSLSEAIRWAEEQNLQILLDEEFENDMYQVICNHEHEAGLRNPWED